jgi:FkbM family methyltransferase
VSDDSIEFAGRPSQVGHDAVFDRFKCWKGFVEPGFTVNFLGVRTRDYYWKTQMDAQCLGGKFVAAALPAFDESYVEWVDLLEAVLAARNQFMMIELGAGYGRWIVNAAAALRCINGPLYKLIGVEAEPTHFRWMKEHIRDNAVDESRCELIEAAVADKSGWVQFHVGAPSECYGQAIWRPTVRGRLCRLRNDVIRRLTHKGTLSGVGEQLVLKRVRALSLKTLLRPLDNVDLIDLDIQGYEFTVLDPAADALDQKVGRVHVGTHGRIIESQLRGLFQRLGWESKFDFPSLSESTTPWGRIKFQDGIQSWVNPSLQKHLRTRPR